MAGFDSVLEDPRLKARLRESLAPGAAPPPLRDLKIKLTPRCNLRCRMCGYWRKPAGDLLGAAAWKRVLSEAAALGCGKVHFSGGEVFTREDFLEIAGHAASLGLKVNLTTNGTMVDRAKAKALARLGLHGISISLDGPDAKSHDAVRGVPGAFKAAVKAVRLLADPAWGRRRAKVRVNFVVMRGNFRSLPDMVELAGSLGACDLVPMPVDDKGCGRLRLSTARILEYNRELAPRVAELRRRWGFPDSFESVHPFGVTEKEARLCKKGLYARGLDRRRPCLAPWLHLFAAWDGRVYPCCMTNGRVPPLGDLRSSSLAEVFNGQGYIRLREAFRRGEQLAACGSCDLFLRENSRLHEALRSEGPASSGPPRLPSAA